jgi:murein DD-endopeptidase MepM/ murein hydrolase activator NlpD
VDGAYTFCYYHMASVTPTVGTTVPVGTQIGVESNTGNVTGTHLHFEAYLGNHADPWPPPYGDPVEPLTILRNHGVTI